MKICIFGAGGRMGKAVTSLVQAADDVTVVGAVEGSGSPLLGRDVGEAAGVGNLGVAISEDLSSALLGADVLIDFSLPPAFETMLRTALKAEVAVVCGTTGLDDGHERLMDRAAERIALLWAPNMSLGVHVLCQLVEQAVRMLGPGYDPEIVELHHGRKADAPSGTARALLAAVQRARPELSPIYGRQGEPGPRPQSEVGVHALRGGGVIGDHSVHLLGPLERLEITHRALSRDVFAAGALRAARFVAGAKPGRYTLADVVSAE